MTKLEITALQDIAKRRPVKGDEFMALMNAMPKDLRDYYYKTMMQQASPNYHIPMTEYYHTINRYPVAFHDEHTLKAPYELPLTCFETDD
jgi:hypothetical protein